MSKIRLVTLMLINRRKIGSRYPSFLSCRLQTTDALKRLFPRAERSYVSPSNSVDLLASLR